MADDVDLQLIEALFQNGRASNKSLADKVGLSESASLARLRNLVANGVVVGFNARLAFDRLGAFQAWIDVRLVDDRSTTIAAFEAVAASEPEVAASFVVGGESHFRLHVITSSFDAFQDLSRRLLSRDTLVRDVRGTIIYKIGRTSPEFPRHVLTRLFERLADSWE